MNPGCAIFVPKNFLEKISKFSPLESFSGQVLFVFTQNIDQSFFDLIYVVIEIRI